MRNNSLNEEFYDDLEVEDVVSSDIELDGKPFRKFVMFAVDFSPYESTHKEQTIKNLKTAAKKLEYIIDNSCVKKHSGVSIYIGQSGSTSFEHLETYDDDFRYASRCKILFFIDGYMKPAYVKTMMDYMFSEKNNLHVSSIGIYDYIDDNPNKYTYISNSGANFIMGSYDYKESTDELKFIMAIDIMQKLSNQNDIYPYYKFRNINLNVIVKDTLNTKSTYKGKNKIVNPCQFDQKGQRIYMVPFYFESNVPKFFYGTDKFGKEVTQYYSNKPLFNKAGIENNKELRNYAYRTLKEYTGDVEVYYTHNRMNGYGSIILLTDETVHITLNEQDYLYIMAIELHVSAQDDEEIGWKRVNKQYKNLIGQAQ